MAIGKKIRFEVFKRDGFVCQYCGNHPPDITLEVDHIDPKSKGGSDDINNLTTSCFDCNRGKSNTELKQIPNSLINNNELLKERESQYIEYHKILAKIDKRISNEVNKIVLVFESFFPDKTPTSEFKKRSIQPFIQKLNVFEVKDAMEIACSKFENENDSIYTKGKGWSSKSSAALSYFCGICWNKIKNNE
jgi:hypothetical protein